MSTNEPQPPARKQPPSLEDHETRLSFVESVISAGNAVGRRPGTAPTTTHIHDERSAAEVQAGVPPLTPGLDPAHAANATTPAHLVPAPAPHGSYDPAATYAVGDVVTFNGLSYRSLDASNHGNTPNVSPGHWHQA